RVLADCAPPERLARWREAGIVERDAWAQVAGAGLLGLSVAPEYGGAGGDFRHEAVVIRRLGLIGADGWGVPQHNGIVAPYIDNYGTEEQKRRWLPGIVSGELISAIAMTEPGAGSDLRGMRTVARSDEQGYRLSGQKTFISNGQLADLIIVAARTGGPDSKAISLFGIETKDAEGFRRGRNLDKVGLEMGDTSELFFDDVPIHAANLIGGEEGRGLSQLMRQLPQERLIIAIEALALIEAAVDHTIDYVRQRRAFGQRLIDFQNTQFRLAECKTEAMVARSFVDQCIERFVCGEFDAEQASMAKLWVTERAQQVVDTCLQLFGGYGYMNEYPIAQMYKDVRVKRIYGGTSEIMKLLIARSFEG
ncbi:MAG: acyl-CoA dehydrogenase family protein, partial [Novosphingobium sp.]